MVKNNKRKDITTDSLQNQKRLKTVDKRVEVVEDDSEDDSEEESSKEDDSDYTPSSSEEESEQESTEELEEESSNQSSQETLKQSQDPESTDEEDSESSEDEPLVKRSFYILDKSKMIPLSTKKDEEDEEEDDEDETPPLQKVIKFLKGEIGESDKITETNFNEIKSELEKREPNIKEIINSSLNLKQKTDLIELYKIYKCYNPFSDDSLSLKNKINKNFKYYLKEAEEYNKLSETSKEHASKLNDKQSLPSLKSQILNLDIDSTNLSVLLKKYEELQDTDYGEEYSKLKAWIQHAISIPYNKLSSPAINGVPIYEILKNINENFNRELYGMNSVKEQLLLFINKKLHNNETKGCSIGLLGPPGVGKTSIAKCLGKSLCYPFTQISFGGINNVEFLTGHDYTYIGSKPGEIVRSMNRLGSKNGILFFDEFDKVTDKKTICSSLLHITDFAQNNNYRDNYLAEISIDLSHIWFIYSMNNPPQDSALRDRIFMIKVPGYSKKDKFNILKSHIIPKTLQTISKTTEDIKFDDNVINYIIDKSDSQDEGVRNLERSISEIINKIHFLVTVYTNDSQNFNLSKDKLKGIKYPVSVSTNMIDVLLKEMGKNEKDVFLNMYI